MIIFKRLVIWKWNLLRAGWIWIGMQNGDEPKGAKGVPLKVSGQWPLNRRLVSFLKAETFERGQYIIKEGEAQLYALSSLSMPYQVHQMFVKTHNSAASSGIWEYNLVWGCIPYTSVYHQCKQLHVVTVFALFCPLSWDTDSCLTGFHFYSTDPFPTPSDLSVQTLNCRTPVRLETSCTSSNVPRLTSLKDKCLWGTMTHVDAVLICINKFI